MLKVATKSRRFGRPLIAVVVAYAVAVQSLFIALGGVSQLAAADAAAPAFELCHHETGGAPAGPIQPDHSRCNHCIFCSSGAHPALIGMPPALSQRTQAVVAEVVPSADTNTLPALSAYSIAHPRGPPLRA